MSRMTREQSRDLTQQKLREAALKEFAFAGFAGASIDRISEAAGFSRGAFYANYKGKHELMLELMCEMSALEVERWRELILAHAADSDDFAASVAERFEAFMQETPWALFAVEAQLQARRDPLFAARHREYMGYVNQSIKELLSMSFQQAGKQLPEDLELLGHTFYSLALGLFLSTDPVCPTTGAKAAGAAMARLYSGLLAPTRGV
ncbi:TetR/AcrR family transcriptional regulator [Pseudomonas lopnurensis]|uniref:TetR/AcrR family transcriptional regulator n=1 Tax=Pseudomonas lopnurensis TaxID=1477517 RepID=UPI0028AE6A63|nr:TetR/AcrR family transcriptional regulator [Pseudomonas lopnurensis]